MKKEELISTIKGTASRTLFALKKVSPEILVGAGIVGTVASTVIACRATTKLSGILEKSKKDIEQVHTCLESGEYADDYSEADAKKDLTVIYVQTGVKVALNYLPAFMLGALSITGIVASHNILRKRNFALAAAYATIDQSFKEYRKRVVERFGEDTEHELRYNIKAKKFEETVTDDKGKEKKVKTNVMIADPNEYSDYARCFDDGCTGWEKNPEYNLMFLKSNQSYFNDLLKARGHVFLNEVYDRLGFQRTTAGQVVGWVYDEKNPSGDNFIDFGIFNTNRERADAFINGYERSIMLDFNVDGPILEKI